MTGVVVKYLSQSQILKGIQEKNAVVPKYFFDGFQRLLESSLNFTESV